MRNELQGFLENDSICYREAENDQNEYKQKLAEVQKEKTDRIFDFLKDKFGVSLKVFYEIPLEAQDQSVMKIKPLLKGLDPYVLTSLYSIASAGKSSAIALAMLYMEPGQISIKEAVDIARVDENF